MTPLADRLVARITRAGPIPLSEYMAACLLDPEHGYYATRDPLGAAGDFTTAPEISQMFGELLGLWLAQVWQDQGAPPRAVLAEAGPGRGTLMADILRVARAMPGFAEAIEIHLVEASPVLRAAQADRLTPVSPVWHDHVDSLPADRPLFLVANEFFDALPIRQFRRAPGGWAETQVGVSGSSLRLGRAPPAPIAALDHRLADTRTGDIVEICPAAGSVMAGIAARLAAQGGAALIVDYGGWRSLGDTFQAVAGHKIVDPLSAPGQADLTAHVDFEALWTAASHAAPGLRRSQCVGQGVFLERLGIGARAQALAHRQDRAGRSDVVAAHRRLTHPDEMGTLFQVMALCRHDAPELPGLSHDA